MHLCILYTFQNQQWLLPYTALTYWFCNWDGVFTAPYRLGHSIKQIVLFLNVNALVSSPWSLRMWWNVKFFHCWKAAASWAILISLNISFCLNGCLSWLHLIAWGFATCFFNGDVVISPMPQPPTLKDHGIPLCLPASLKSVWHRWSTNTWAAASTGLVFTDASKSVTWQKYAFQKTAVP